jgi:hypothetical protein
MPGGNIKGPEGRGPMTGRGAGFCAGNQHLGFDAYGRGCGRGRGMAYGRGAGFGKGMGNAPGHETPNAPPEVERWNLERETEFLREELSRAEARLKEIGGTEEAKA